jgi:hypothetical protein
MAGIEFTDELIAELKKKVGFIGFIYRPEPYKEIRVEVNDIIDAYVHLKKKESEDAESR